MKIEVLQNGHLSLTSTSFEGDVKLLEIFHKQQPGRTMLDLKPEPTQTRSYRRRRRVFPRIDYTNDPAVLKISRLQVGEQTVLTTSEWPDERTQISKGIYQIGKHLNRKFSSQSLRGLGYKVTRLI